MIFSFLDDISLCMVGQVCQWWHQLAGEQDQWKKHVLTRWPSLFPPADKPSTSWQNLYIKMWGIFFNVCDFDKWMSGLLLRARCWKFPGFFPLKIEEKSILSKSSLICHLYLVLLVFTQKFEILGTVLNVNFLVNEASFWMYLQLVPFVWPGLEMACEDVFVFSSLTKLMLVEVGTCLPITWVGHGIHLLHVQVQGCTDLIFFVT